MFHYSCVNKGKDGDSDKDSVNEETFTTDPKTRYKLPTPVELYRFLKEQNLPFKKELMNPSKNESKYNTADRKALNFGVYASDLAYCAVFEKPQETYEYFKTSRSLADQLSLAEGFNEVIAKRIEKNLNNLDSLYDITSDAYWDACTYLESQGKEDVLAFIIVGSWIESVNITFGMVGVDKFSPTSEIVIRVAEQQLLLDNLLDYLTGVKKNDQMNKIILKLKDIQESYDKLYDNQPDVPITKSQFKEIYQKVKNLRNAFVS